jgi:radical SAM protein (TIGR01212 family)
MQWRSANPYFRARFGCKVYKLALDGGMTCPNRDGTLDTRGCIFCSAGGSGDFAEPLCGSIEEQLDRAKSRVAAKAGPDARYIAYFQSYTNTYAPAERLEALFAPVLARPEIVALSVATRPDCLPAPVLDLLERLNREKPVFVELGLQTIHPQTAALIRRGYDLPVFDRAMRELSARGLEPIVHVILGLPGEDETDMLETVRYVGASGAAGIKLQLLHVLEHTDLAALWRQGKVPTMTLEEYAVLLGRCLQVLPPEIVIHRLTGDGAKKDLLAPLWTADKKHVLNYMNQYLRGLPNVL